MVNVTQIKQVEQTNVIVIQFLQQKRKEKLKHFEFKENKIYIGSIINCTTLMAINSTKMVSEFCGKSFTNRYCS